MTFSPPSNDEINLDYKIFTQLYTVAGIKVLKASLCNDVINLFTQSKSRVAKCPRCDQSSQIIRSRYLRKLMDLPIGATKVVIHLLSRKFKCNNPICRQLIFSEQNTLVTEKYSRKTNRVFDLLTKILVEISSIKGSYLTSLLNIGHSSSSCLRLVHSLPIPNPVIPECIGIDDWAKRKGMKYGTIIVNGETGKAIELIDSRKCDEIVGTLSKFKGVSFVTRDRSSAYGKAISQALPNAHQIADKFHLSKNISDAVYEQIKDEYKQIRQSYLDNCKDEYPEAEEIIKPLSNSDNISPKTQLLFDSVKRLQTQEFSIRGIAKMLNTSRTTVKKYFGMSEPVAPQRVYRNNYEKHLDIIEVGMQNQQTRAAIFHKMKQSGFRGEYSAFNSWFKITFTEYCKSSQTRGCANNQLFKMSRLRFNRMTPRRLSIHVCNPQWGVCIKSGALSDDYILANEIIGPNKLLCNLRNLATSFKQLLKQTDPQILDLWMIQAENSGLDKIKSFVRGINMDRQAVENAIKYKWTNGVVEGNVNRLKSKKREMYGKASFELLRRKVCLSVTG